MILQQISARQRKFAAQQNNKLMQKNSGYHYITATKHEIIALIVSRLKAIHFSMPQGFHKNLQKFRTIVANLHTALVQKKKNFCMVHL